MEITFVVPCKDLAGGLKVVAAYGNALLRRGHKVNIVYPKRIFPLKEELRRKIKRKLNNERDHLDYFRGNLTEVNEINEKTVPESDILVATSWETAEWCKNFPLSYGKKFYLIQHYETWSGAKERVDKTLKLPYQKIVISNWLKNVVSEVSGETNIPLLTNGRDFFISESLGEGLNRNYDVGMLYSRVSFKRSEDGIKAIELVRARLPEIKVVLFGSEYPREPLGKMSFFRRPAQSIIREIYLSTRVWISSSETEGFCLPALEGISLGCSVVATNSLGIEDIITNGVNGFLVEPLKPELLAEKIIEVLTNPELEKKFRINGLQKSEFFSWEKSASELEELLMKD
ncbi:glycosyltransferase family 4 protein [bacterium]|nr:glycosyltransferase family 4 protein [bacterium]